MDSNVVVLSFGRKQTDGGKARIRARRQVYQQEPVDDLVMLHADVIGDESCREMSPVKSHD